MGDRIEWLEKTHGEGGLVWPTDGGLDEPIMNESLVWVIKW